MNNQNPDSTAAFPEVIEHKGRMAKIYRGKHRHSYRYEVTYRDSDGQWKRESFHEHDAARKHANVIVRQLDDATQPFLMLRGKDRFIYERALDLLRPTGLPLDMAIAEFVEAKNRLNGACTLREAVETTRNLHAKPVSTVTVQQVVDEFVKVKDSEGLSHLYRRDLRTRLARFGIMELRHLRYFVAVAEEQNVSFSMSFLSSLCSSTILMMRSRCLSEQFHLSLPLPLLCPFVCLPFPLASGRYRQLLAGVGAQPSMSLNGNCYDNAAMESFWSSLKRELIHRVRFVTRAAARAAVFDWTNLITTGSGPQRSRLSIPVDFEK